MSNSSKHTDIAQDRIFKMDEVLSKLEGAKGKKLGEVDVNNAFKKAEMSDKVTGIAGDVIEKSVLGYKSDSKQDPDILIDGILHEVKTTGVREKRNGEEVAKEPVSITAVSPDTIISEEFESSHYWEKLEHVIFVYYKYDSRTTVKAIQYKEFPIIDYHFHEFSDEDKKKLKNDWELVKNYIINHYDEDDYSGLSSELRKDLIYIDTAPKKNPRFRLKRSFASTIFTNRTNELPKLSKPINSFSELDKVTQDLTAKYKDKTVLELLKLLKIQYVDENKLSKSIGEQIVLKMFGADVKKMNKVDLFAKAGVFAKTICVTSKGKQTEAVKLLPLDEGEAINNIPFEETSIFDYFNEHQLLCIIFQEEDKNPGFKNNKFVGFERIYFSNDFIEANVKNTWEKICNLILNNLLKKEKCLKKDGTVIINPNGLEKTAINFPKAKDNKVFVRGSAENSSDKTTVINGISMTKQYIWIKGSAIIDMIETIKK